VLLVEYFPALKVIVVPSLSGSSCPLLYPENKINRPLWKLCIIFFSFGATAPQWARASSFTKCLYRTRGRTTIGKTPLDEWSARRRDLYLTTYNIQQKTNIHAPVEFEPAVSTGEHPQSHALDSADRGTGN